MANIGKIKYEAQFYKIFPMSTVLCPDKVCNNTVLCKGKRPETLNGTGKTIHIKLPSWVCYNEYQIVFLILASSIFYFNIFTSFRFLWVEVPQLQGNGLLRFKMISFLNMKEIRKEVISYVKYELLKGVCWSWIIKKSKFKSPLHIFVGSDMIKSQDYGLYFPCGFRIVQLWRNVKLIRLSSSLQAHLSLQLFLSNIYYRLLDVELRNVSLHLSMFITFMIGNCIYVNLNSVVIET